MVGVCFNQGNGAESYSGTSRGGTARTYVLTFEREAILREWEQDERSN